MAGWKPVPIGQRLGCDRATVGVHGDVEHRGNGKNAFARQ
jgi:hypothetical protein